MRLYSPICLLLLGLVACRPAATQDDGRAGYVTLLGDDTLAVERFEHTPDGMRADVVLRTPRTTFRQYEIEFDDDDQLVRFESATREGGADAPVVRREVVTPTADGLRFETTADGETEQSTIEGDPSMLPFIDMVHWPFEIALMRAANTGQDSLVQHLFTSRGAMPFVFRNLGNGRMSVQHPFRGVMDVEVDPAGRLHHLDASQTTRKLTVNRVSDVDVEAVASRFAAQDAAGRSFGALSGRGFTEATVGDANISVDYGQPAKRGRDIWGSLVPYGELWRTGANRATHIETDRTLVFDGLEVPPGSYTLFSVPEADGGTLIINSQTGQNGNSYNPEHDLGRVPMTAEPLSETVELFTIDVTEWGDGDAIRLQWDEMELVAPFEVR
ncbi:MAG: DUF2911 domain-containing protein [Bacteroidota bacterium]